MAPEGMVDEPSSYMLDVIGSLTLEGANRFRFSFEVKFSTNQEWLEFSMHVTLRPTVVEVRATAAEGKVHFRFDDAGARTDRSYTFEELQHPEKILREFGGALLPGLVGALGFDLQGPRSSAPAVGLRWTAREDKLKVGASFMRVYRLQTLILDHFPIVIYVSRIGEILRIELPDEIVLANDALLNL